MKTIVFTSGVIMKNRKILILKRRIEDGIHGGCWDSTGGHLKEHESAEEAIIREAREETGLDVRIKMSGKVFEIIEDDERWVVIPFLLEALSDEVKISEHTEYKWIRPKDLENYPTVPDLPKICRMFGLL